MLTTSYCAPAEGPNWHNRLGKIDYRDISQLSPASLTTQKQPKCPRDPTQAHQGTFPDSSISSAASTTATCWGTVTNSLRTERPQLGPAVSILANRVTSGERPIATCGHCCLCRRQSASLLQLKRHNTPRWGCPSMSSAYVGIFALVWRSL